MNVFKILIRKIKHSPIEKRANNFISTLTTFLQGEFVKLFVTYSFGSIFLYGANFLLIPLYTRVLTKAEFGQIELITNLTTILGILFAFGLPQVVFIEYFHLDKKQRINLVLKAIILYCLLSIPLFCISYFIISKNSATIFKSIIDSRILLMAFGAVFFLFFQSIFISIYQITKKAKKLTFFQVGIGLLTLGFNIYLVYYLKLGIFGYYATALLVAVFSFIYISINAINQTKDTFPLKYKIPINQALAYLKLGSPFILSSVSLWLLSGADRWIILHYLDEAEVGIYSVAYRFASVYYPLLIIPLLNAYTPKIFEKFALGNYNQKIPYLFIFSFVVFSILAVLTPILAKFMIDPVYYEALPLISPLIAGYGIFFITQAIASILIYKKKIKQLSVNILIASAANILFNFIFVSRWGLNGSIFAFIIGHIVWLLFTIYQTKHTEKQLQIIQKSDEYR